MADFYAAAWPDFAPPLTVFLEDLVPETPVALYYSLQTAFAEGPRHGHASAFGRWCEILEEIGCGYMIIDETSLERATVADGLLHANGMAFRVIAFPSVTTMSDACRRIAAAFQQAGGRIWATGEDSVPAPGNARHIPLDMSQISGLVKDLPGITPNLMAAPSVRRAFGRDPSGFWRYALFNESGERQAADITDVSDLEIWNCRDGSILRHGDAGKLTIALEEGDVFCLRFRSGSRVASGLRLPAMRPDPVYSQVLDKGWTFRTEADEASAAISVDAGWQGQGHADYSGTGTYSCRIETAAGLHAELELPGVAVAVSVWLDGERKGDGWRPPFRVTLGYLSPGPHKLELQVANTAANRYYAGTSYAGDLWPDGSGLTRPPVLRFFSTDEQNEEP